MMIQICLIALLALTTLGFGVLFLRAVQISKANARQHLTFAALAKVSPAGIWRTNPEGEPIYVNEAWLEMTGLTHDSWRGSGWAKAIHPDDREMVFASWHEAVSRKQIFRNEWRWLRSDGSTKWVATLGSPEFSRTGELQGYVGLNIDIDHSKRLEHDLQLARERAENAGAAKTNFLANMSHEIRTPMNGVIGFTELLLQSDLREDQREQAQLIADSGRAMLRLLNDILDVAKIEAGQMQLLNEATNLRQKILHCVQLMTPIAKSKGVSLTMAVAADMPEMVELDRQRTRQIILNLLGNAVKFTDNGSVHVSAEVERLAEGDFVKIAVIDSGIGIAQDKLQTIFAPFSQEDTHITRTCGGTGLGLTISGQLVKLMGGQIKAESKLGVGSSFTVRLPLLNAEHGEPANAAPATADLIPSGIRSCRVLIAEDHAINQQLILAMAASLNIEAELACNGREAVEAVARADAAGKPFQLVLMDMQMPEMDGLEATRRLRANGYTTRQLPIIALTANCYPDDIAACMQAGMQAHLGKPITLVTLAQEVTNQLRRHQAVPAAQLDQALTAHAAPPVNAGLEGRYRQRKEALLRELENCLNCQPGDVDWAVIASDLHKLSGVAANFGDARLGEFSRRLEQQIKETTEPAMRRAALVREWERLQQAA